MALGLLEAPKNDAMRCIIVLALLIGSFAIRYDFEGVFNDDRDGKVAHVEAKSVAEDKLGKMVDDLVETSETKASVSSAADLHDNAFATGGCGLGGCFPDCISADDERWATDIEDVEESVDEGKEEGSLMEISNVHETRPSASTEMGTGDANLPMYLYLAYSNVEKNNRQSLANKLFPGGTVEKMRPAGKNGKMEARTFNVPSGIIENNGIQLKESKRTAGSLDYNGVVIISTHSGYAENVRAKYATMQWWARSDERGSDGKRLFARRDGKKYLRTVGASPLLLFRLLGKMGLWQNKIKPTTIVFLSCNAGTEDERGVSYISEFAKAIKAEAGLETDVKVYGPTGFVTRGLGASAPLQIHDTYGHERSGGEVLEEVSLTQGTPWNTLLEKLDGNGFTSAVAVAET